MVCTLSEGYFGYFLSFSLSACIMRCIPVGVLDLALFLTVMLLKKCSR